MHEPAGKRSEVKPDEDHSNDAWPVGTRESTSNTNTSRDAKESNRHDRRANHQKWTSSDFVNERDGCGGCEEVRNSIGSCDPSGYSL